MAGPPYYEFKPDTTYPQKKDAENSRWEGTLYMLYDFKGNSYPVGGMAWEEPVKYFKTLKMTWFENVDGFTFCYDSVNRKLKCHFMGAGSEAINMDIDITIRWVLEGRHI